MKQKKEIDTNLIIKQILEKLDELREVCTKKKCRHEYYLIKEELKELDKLLKDYKTF